VEGQTDVASYACLVNWETFCKTKKMEG